MDPDTRELRAFKEEDLKPTECDACEKGGAPLFLEDLRSVQVCTSPASEPVDFHQRFVLYLCGACRSKLYGHGSLEALGLKLQPQKPLV
jgi:hypothetical protein